MDNREYIMDRIKKLTSALYRVTDLLSDKEPLKWTLRDIAIDIFNNFLKDKDISVSDIINILDLFSGELSISNLNYDILKKEYKNLMSFIQENKKKIILPEQKIVFDTIPTTTIPISPIKANSRKTPVSLISNSRKEKILDILKDQNPRNISEIMPSFEQISEKSIQRDLIDLIRLGRVTAEGDKRWRKYKIIQQDIDK